MTLDSFYIYFYFLFKQCLRVYWKHALTYSTIHFFFFISKCFQQAKFQYTLLPKKMINVNRSIDVFGPVSSLLSSNILQQYIPLHCSDPLIVWWSLTDSSFNKTSTWKFTWTWIYYVREIYSKYQTKCGVEVWN